MKKTPKRKLALDRETIKRLDPGPLSDAAGAGVQGWSQLCTWYPTNGACTSVNPACGPGWTYAGSCVDNTCVGCQIL